MFINKLSGLLGIPEAKERAESKKRKKGKGDYERLRNTKLQFGAHRGSILDEVPIEYLDWLCGEQEDCVDLLRTYLNHPETTRLRRGGDT